MSLLINFDKYAYFTDRISAKARVISIVSIIFLYFLSYILFFSFMGDSVFMLMMFPVLVASALIGMKAGIITQLVCFCFSIAYRFLSSSDTKYIQKFVIGFVMLLIVNFVVGFLREVHKKLKSELKQRKIAEEQREATLAQLRMSLAELENARSELKTLSGLLPICSSCHRIRDEKDNWFNIEQYIAERSDAEFSHGICPDCAKKLYPDYVR